MEGPIYLGLTGPFGSGCTAIAKEILAKDPYLMKVCSLSDPIKKTWANQNPGQTAKRAQLQHLGDEMRRSASDSALLAKQIVQEAQEFQDSSIVFDSIRNVAEVDYLRRTFPDFYLIGVCCSEETRWNRVKSDYDKLGLLSKDFLADEARDHNEEGDSFGQQVGLCMYDADLLLVNDNLPMQNSVAAAIYPLAEKLDGYINLFKGRLRSPFDLEFYMSMAYDASLMSRCHKRQVGAVAVDPSGAVISVGWNANPKPMRSCIEEFGDCYRILRIDQDLQNMKSCQVCHASFEGLHYPYTCPNCGIDLYKETYKDRALSKCTALHAEEMAILNLGQRALANCTLYTTTFPCFTCAQKIVYSGIKQVVYVESYPDSDSVDFFDRIKSKYDVKLVKFEGIKARAYHRMFSSWRKLAEENIVKKKKGENLKV